MAVAAGPPITRVCSRSLHPTTAGQISIGDGVRIGSAVPSGSGRCRAPKIPSPGFLHPVSPDPPKPDLLVGGVNSRVGWTAVLRLDLSGWRGWRRAVIWIAVAKSTFDPTRNSVALNLRLMDGLRTPIYMPAPDGGRRNLTNRRKLLHQHCHDRELLRPTGRQAKTAFGGAEINADRERPGAGQTRDR
jgi:hypothetical protein